MTNKQRRYFSYIIGAELAAVILLLLFVSCTKTVYLPVETVIHHTDTLMQTVRLTTADTIREKEYVHDTRYDSVAPILDSLNRVIGWDRYHFREVTKMGDRERSRFLAQIDSLKRSRTDSVYIEKPVPVEVVKEVERSRSWWETTLIWIGSIACCIAIMALLLSWSVYKVRKR